MIRNAIRSLMLTLLLAGTAVHCVSAQGLKEIHIDCDPDDFAYIYENYQEDIYIPVTVTHAGTIWPEVLMRLRGDSSREYPKKSLKVQFGDIPFINGKFTVNFNAEYHDKSYMHSVLSTRLFAMAGIPGPDMEYVRLYLNGSFFGLYVMTENMDDQFIADHGLDPDGILYKAGRDGACLSIFDNVFYHWELNSGSDPFRDRLTALIAQLNAPGNEFLGVLQSEFDLSNAINFLGMNMLLSNGSTYYHNYFLFFDNPSGRWNLIPWDLDRTFSTYSLWYPYHRSSGLWTPDNPLLERVILDDQVFEYLKVAIVILEESIFNTGVVFPLMDSIQAVISASVAEDTTDNIADVEAWQDQVILDKEFVLGRYQQLLSQFTHHPSSFQVNRITGYRAPGEEVEFTWQVSTDPDGDEVTYTFRFGPDVFFEDPATVEIGDMPTPSLSFQLPGTEGKYYWMVEATDGTHVVEGFDTRNELFVMEQVTMPVINEINYNSSPDFDPGDWVEIHNPGNSTFDLGGWKLMDEDNEHVFTFASGTVIGPQGYLVVCRDTVQFRSVFPDVMPVAGDIGFGFDAGGEWIRLYNPFDYLADDVHYRDEEPWPEAADGEGSTLELLNPSLDNAMWYNWAASDDHGTPGAQNGKYSPDGIAVHSGLPDDLILVWPNPCRERATLIRKDGQTSRAVVFLLDLQGRQVSVTLHGAGDRFELDTEVLGSGTYVGIIRFEDGAASRFLMIRE